ncbi:MAG: extracellular solute-binding protein family 1 [Eubacterium sp.]|jgi:putative aldouronate transport system substrate-binding protein|nr:extracellular solute-binding protein family 1 [Eubacterium sp.]
MHAKKLVKSFCLTLALVTALATGLTGCGGSSSSEATTSAASTAAAGETTAAQSTEAAGSKIDTSKEVEMIGYLLGDRPQGMDAVMEKLNEKLKKDINATMTINYIGWGDLQSKYPLVLASGENVDWIFTANWAYYGQEAAKGAFYELNTDMIKTYMPKHNTATNERAWKEALVNGKVYMVPTSTPDKKVNEFAIREDLRKKYNVPEVKSWLDIEPYLEAIKKNEPGMIPLNIDSAIDIGRPFFYQLASTTKSYYDLLAATSGGSGIVTDTDDANGVLYKITEEPVVNDYKATAKVIKSWYDKGYINRNAFSNKVRSRDSFEQGKSAVAFGNTIDMQSTIDKAKAAGWEIKVMAGLSTKGTYPADSYINNGFAVAAKSKNPERVLMAMDLIMEDPDYNQLAYYGVEGVNYVVKDGKIALPDGVTADKNTYPPDASGFWFTNKDLLKPQASWSDEYIRLREDAKKQVAPYAYSAFTPNTDKVKTEVANLNQVIVQYFNPINLGMVKDVDAAFKTLDDKLKAANIDKLMTEMKAQTDAYNASMK